MMSTLTFNTSLPLGWKSWPANWMCSKVESLLTVMTGWLVARPLDHRGRDAVHRSAELLGAVWKNTSPSTGLVTVNCGVPPATLWVSDVDVGQATCVPAAVPTDVQQAADRIVAVVRLIVRRADVERRNRGRQELPRLHLLEAADAQSRAAPLDFLVMRPGNNVLPM